MDGYSAQTEVLSRECSDYSGRVLVALDRWEVRELILTPAKIKEIWNKMQTCPTLFSDITRFDTENFSGLVTQANSFWMEVVEGQELVGLIYLTDLNWVIDCTVHIVFFDRKLSEKRQLCRKVIGFLFDTFNFHRMTATVPAIFFMTVRLATTLGFKKEGTKRQAHPMSGKWVDELQLGLLREEAL